MSDSVLDRLVGSLNGALEFNANAVIPPIALLWPDERRQWESVIVRFSELQPILTLGDYDVASGSGPAYWIRCVIAGTVEARLLHGTPIVYLPGVARSDLRAADSCPPELAPIAELQYRSQWFSHPNSKDWSVRALLTHPGRGLGLQVADDAKCAEALALALDQLLDEPADGLTKFLDADFFNDLVNPDPMSSLLGWLNDPAGFRSRVGEARWAAFIGQCKADFGFDPLHDGEITAARKLGERSGIWGHAWRNFADTPARYPGIPDQLRRARPQELLVENLDVWPQDNENLEDQLRASLRDLQAATAEGARSDVRRFDAGHSWRRGTVWADLGWAPLAFALEQLVAVAELTAHPLPSDNLDALVADYADRGYKADDAMIRALAAVPATPDRDAVVAAAQRMYQPWVDAGAKAMQTMIGPMAHAQTYEAASRVTATPGVVTVFVDGLRLDIANQVAERLTSRG